MSDYRFELDIGFNDHLYIQFRTTSTYSATANLYNSKITTEPAKFPQPLLSSPAIPWQRLLTLEII
jgi:hypothetical protein